MKEIAVIMTIAEGRSELVDQTLRTLYANTKYPHKFYIQGSNISPHQHVQIRNEIIKSLKNWEYVVSVDDDVFFTEGWLKYLVETHQKYPDIQVLSAISYPLHQTIEEREDIVLTTRFIGACCSIRRSLIDGLGGIPVRRLWDKRIAEVLYGKSIARLRKNVVAHCGVTRFDGYRYSAEIADHYKKIAAELGAITG